MFTRIDGLTTLETVVAAAKKKKKKEKKTKRGQIRAKDKHGVILHRILRLGEETSLVARRM